MKKLLRSLLLLFSPLVPLMAMEKGVDTFFVIDPIYPLHRSKIDLNASFFQGSGLTDFVVSPRLCSYINGDFDVNLGLGFRRVLDGKLAELGYHAFYDVSIQNPLMAHQVGFAGEYLTEGYDLRLNYYHPLKTISADPLSLKVKSHRIVEGEFLKRLGNLSVAVSPMYNVDTNTFAIKPKFLVPLSRVNLEAGIHLSQNPAESSSYFAASIPLYNTGARTVSRKSTIHTGAKPVSVFKYFEKKNMDHVLP